MRYNKFNTFFGLNLTLVYTFPMCMAWRFHFPIRNYDFKGMQCNVYVYRMLEIKLYFTRYFCRYFKFNLKNVGMGHAKKGQGVTFSIFPKKNSANVLFNNKSLFQTRSPSTT